MKRQAVVLAVVMVGVGIGLLGPKPALAQSGLSYYAITPCRVVDTRVPTDPATPKRGTFTDGEVRAYTFSASTDCPGLPTNAGGWALHISFSPSTTASYLTVYPSGVTRPGTSTVLSYPGSYTGTNAVVPAGSGGTINVYCQYAGTVIIDVNGYFAP